MSPTTATTSRKGKIDPVEAYQLRVNHRLSYQQIADKYGVKRSSVIQRLKRFAALIHNSDDRSAYEAIRINAMTTLEERLLVALGDESKIQDASLNNVAYAFQQLHQARRLEEGKATEQVSVLTRLLSDAHATLHKPAPAPAPAPAAEPATPAPSAEAGGRGDGGVSDSS